MNTILDAVANNDLQIKVDAIDETALAEMAQKVANRISLSLLLAALILGAALLARIETPFTVLGYPVIAIVFFATSHPLRGILFIVLTALAGIGAWLTSRTARTRV